MRQRLREGLTAWRGARVSAALAAIVVAGAAGAAALWLITGSDAPMPTATEVDRLAERRPKAEPLRLDTLPAPSRAERTKTLRTSAKAAPVIGAGTGRFADGATAKRARGATGDDAIVEVDGHRPAADKASDAEVRLELAALERENARVEAALRRAQGPASGTGDLIWPVRGPITSPFGRRWGRLHAGIDIGVPTGTPVHAADSGRVVVSGVVGGYGNYICIQHTRRLSTCYGHNSRLGVRRGESVRKGEVIARSGCTGHCYGPHVHFEVRVGGRPVDPRGYL